MTPETWKALERSTDGEAVGGQNKQGGCKEEQTLLAAKPKQAREPNRPEVEQTLRGDADLILGRCQDTS